MGVDEPGLADIDNEADQCRIAVEEERWVDATLGFRETQYAVNRRTNYVDFYNILKFRTFNEFQDKDYPRGDMEAEGQYNLNDIMNGIIKRKLGIIPEEVVWGAQSSLVFRAHA